MKYIFFNEMDRDKKLEVSVASFLAFCGFFCCLVPIAAGRALWELIKKF